MSRSNNRRGTMALSFGVWLVMAFLLLPLAAMVPMSFSSSALLRLPPPGFSLRWYEAYLFDQRWMEATLNSVLVGTATAVFSVVLGVCAAYGLARSTWKWKAIVQAFVLAPLLVPSIVIAVGTYYLFSFLYLNGTYTGLIIGHTIITFPYTVVVITASLERFDFRLEQIAVSLGATPLRTFFAVTLPIIRPAVIVALLFAFLNSFDEVVIATFLAGPETTTLPKQMWDGIRYELSPVIAAISSILITLSSIIILVTEVLNRRGQVVADGATGRP
jgi:putative spermidine/putrescine transport system permease protein